MCGALALVAVTPTGAHAQGPRDKHRPVSSPGAPAPAGDGDASAGAPSPGPGKKSGKPKVFDFSGIDISGQNRSPQLLYFLERANEELERASLERRSFIPEMVRSIEEDRL
jgi:hypothetical protein